MQKEAMRGIDFELTGSVTTDNGAYIILVDETVSSYFPVRCDPFHAQVVQSILSAGEDFDISEYGLYFTMMAMFKAHDMIPTQVAVTICKAKGTSCCFDVMEENELGIKVSRVPVTMPDAMVISAMADIPIVVYGSAGSDFSFKISKDIPKNNIMSFIGEEIARSEKMASIEEED